MEVFGTHGGVAGFRGNSGVSLKIITHISNICSKKCDFLKIFTEGGGGGGQEAGGRLRG